MTTLPKDPRRAYQVKLLRGRFGYGPATKGSLAIVRRMPVGVLYLSMNDAGPVFETDAIEGVDFEFTTQPPTEVRT